MYEIISIDSEPFGDEQWQQFHALLRLLKERYDSPCRTPSWAVFKKRMSSYLAGDPNYRHSVVMESGKMVGWIEFRVRGAGTSDQMVGSRFDYNYDQLPPTFAVAITSWILERMDHLAADRLYYTPVNNRLGQIAWMWPAELIANLNEYVLKPDKVAFATLDQWLTEIPPCHKQLRLEVIDTIPDELWVPIAEFLTVVGRDIPAERPENNPVQVDVRELKRLDSWRRENGIAAYYVLLFSPHNKIIGLTDASVNRLQPQTVYQHMTGVAREFRGQGLAKWLKAAIYYKIMRDYREHERVLTWTRSVNEPMQHINAAMGFELKSQTAEYGVDRANLIAFVET